MTKHQIEVITSCPGPLTQALCWVHARRKFFVLADIAANGKRGKDAGPISLIAFKVVKRMDALFEIERDINGLAADERLQQRQQAGRSHRRLGMDADRAGKIVPKLRPRASAHGRLAQLPGKLCDSIVLRSVITSVGGESRGDAVSRPREKRERGEQDLFRSRLDPIINMKHELVRLAQAIEVYADGPGMPPLPTRLMVGLAILKHTFNLSDEVLCGRWVETPTSSICAARSSSATQCPSTSSPYLAWPN